MQMITAENIPSLIQTGALIFIWWSFRTWFRSHQRSHERIAESNRALTDAIDNLASKYGSKESVRRAHNRIDDVEGTVSEHSQRLVIVETKLKQRGSHVSA